jgi:hypothetical protein
MTFAFRIVVDGRGFEELDGLNAQQIRWETVLSQNNAFLTMVIPNKVKLYFSYFAKCVNRLG